MSKKEEQNGITIDHLHRLNQKNISAWNMKRLMNIVRKGVLSTLDEKIQGSAGEDEAMVQITSENQAKAAAKKIFNNVAKPGSKYIYQEDLMRFMREDEVLKTMRLFEEGKEQKGISKRALKNWVMVVEEMNILTTVFLKFDNHKIYYPNSVLSTKPIHNYYRSPDMGDAIDFCVHISTPIEKIATMKERITKYVDNRSDHWYPAPAIVMRDVEDMNRLKFSVWLSHKMNHQDMGERWARRALLVEEMVKTFRELDIEYRMLPLDVNVRNMPPISSSRLPSNWTASAA
ncbi:UNVERIFIED_CONTAM: Mechanosensitive ion channel protein 6 [Sesamum calycinum]|uniref:Mechanosensitive ion channel protein 6 n=1 Tax=Sesamum calycinum TaxID=2727403 RepID=A0AAW2PAE0_9LAMI